MFEFFFLIAAVYGLASFVKKTFGGVRAPGAVVPVMLKSWAEIDTHPPILRKGAHYPIALRFSGRPDRTHLATVLGSTFDRPKIWLPGDSLAGLPSPVPASWIRAYKEGATILFGAWDGPGADGSDPFTGHMLQDLRLDAGAGAVRVWVATEDQITANVTPDRVNHNE